MYCSKLDPTHAAIFDKQYAEGKNAQVQMDPEAKTFVSSSEHNESLSAKMKEFEKQGADAKSADLLPTLREQCAGSLPVEPK